MTQYIPEITAEECAEVIQAITKCLRFGLDQVHPETGISNKEQLETEVGQLLCMITMLSTIWNFSDPRVTKAMLDKQDNLFKYTQYEVPRHPVEVGS